MKKPDEIQIGGEHYNKTKMQHWTMASDLNLGYFEGQITKYVDRWKRKNGKQDLEKGKHFLDKLIELFESGKVKGMVQPPLKDALVVVHYYSVVNNFDPEQGKIIKMVCLWRYGSPNFLYQARDLLCKYIAR